MDLSPTDRRLLDALAEGLPLVPRPFAAIGRALGLSESEVVARVERLVGSDIVKRFGVFVRHRELGYRANAMVVWDIDDEEVSAVRRRMAGSPVVTLCYRRPRRPPDWPYNLFCMIHGRDRATVEGQIRELAAELGLEGVRRDILFSRRCFKQRGARYGSAPPRRSLEAA